MTFWESPKPFPDDVSYSRPFQSDDNDHNTMKADGRKNETEGRQLVVVVVVVVMVERGDGEKERGEGERGGDRGDIFKLSQHKQIWVCFCATSSEAEK